MRTAIVLIVASVAGSAVATLPPPSEEAKAQAALAKAKSDWGDKVAAYKLCREQDRVVQQYRASHGAGTKGAASPAATPPCADPGPFVAQSKPLEAAGAHSPPTTATSPPSTEATHAELKGGIKK